MPTHDIQTTLNFIEEQPDGSHLTPTYVGKPSSYIRPITVVPVVIHDVSGHEQDYTLDNNGFQSHHRTSQTKDPSDAIKARYYPEIDKLIKDVSVVFDHTIRRAAQVFQGSSPQAHGPIQRVHIDQTDAAAKQRVEYYFGDKAHSLLKCRYQIINVWRPLKPVLRDPLAVADAKTVSDDDLVPIKMIYPDKVGETCLVKPNPRIRWYFRDRQTPDMVTLFKCFESKRDRRARRVPHSAFVVPGIEGEEARESIEVRALVFYSGDEE
ncbi:hypothetical protein N8T08_002199 [Aspergillus melleus]|uniref:Uncharacterized protein n=1 Tax=Aspergillus melleus TaxID=138277 RepID=A0ACC3B920_9EURO|nr:hypothetical protein N8T08_002199 [Aspergillus melleus]